MMRGMLLVLLVAALSASSAEARRHHRHHGYHMDLPVAPWNDGPAGAKAAPAGDHVPLAPAGWRREPPDPNWNGTRYVSPDGSAWFAVYTSPAEPEPIAAHMRAVAFADGEEITYLRGEHDWIVVSGLKSGRIYFRKAVLGCGGKTWRHIAFEYPAEARRIMDRVVGHAARELDGSDAEDCTQSPVSSR